MDDFIVRALLAGIGIVLVAAPLGCFVVWRRMAYFGDSLAHSALLGIALGLITGMNTNISTIIVGMTFAFLLVWLQQRQFLATDTLLGILAHACLSIGIVVITFLPVMRIDLHSYLFGDILNVSVWDLYWLGGCGLFVITVLIFYWQKLTLMVVNEDLARADGISVFAMHCLIVFLMTILVSTAFRIVGVLLITSLLIVPAATARFFVRSPEGMAIVAIFFGILALIGGGLGSIFLDIPSGPSIVTVAVLQFCLFYLLSLVIQRYKNRQHYNRY